VGASFRPVRTFRAGDGGHSQPGGSGAGPEGRAADATPPVTSPAPAAPATATTTTAAPATPPPPPVVQSAATASGPAAGAPAAGGPSRGRGRGRTLLGPAATSLEAKLRTLPPQPYNIGFLAGNLEARERAYELREVLDNGGWTCSGISPLREVPANFGVFVPRPNEGAFAVVNWATRGGLGPDYRLMPRLPEIHIVIGPPQPAGGRGGAPQARR